MSRIRLRRGKANGTPPSHSGHDGRTSAENRCYAAMAMTGVNDSTKALKNLDKHPLLWATFADAKADVVNRAERLRTYLDSAGCTYRMHSESGAHHYEASFEYGPSPHDPDLPFKMVFHVFQMQPQAGTCPWCRVLTAG